MGRRKNDFTPPAWFDLKKYDGVRGLNEEGWFVQIMRRLPGPGEEGPEKYGIDDPERKELYVQAQQRYRERLKAVRENPLGPDPRYKRTTANRCWHRGGVGLATPNDLWLHQPFDVFGEGTETAHEWEMKCLDGIMGKVKSWDRPIEPRSEAMKALPMMVVNLSLPDSELIASFEMLLEQLRKREPWSTVKPIELKKEMSDWCARAIMPYWDLRLWAEETGTTIPHREYANILFPGERRAESDIAKQTKPKAEKVFSHEYADLLGAFCVRKMQKTQGSSE